MGLFWGYRGFRGSKGFRGSRGFRGFYGFRLQMELVTRLEDPGVLGSGFQALGRGLGFRV